MLSSEAAELYEGALWVLQERSNPKRARFAAGAMRELLVELGKNAGVVSKSGLKERVRALHFRWRRTRRSSDGGIQGSTTEIATDIDLFFSDVEEEYPLKRERMAQTAHGLDMIAGPLPADTEKARVETLMEIDERFNNALHGSASVGLEEVEREIDRFGDLFLSLRRPPLAADLKAIDELLEGGAPNG